MNFFLRIFTLLESIDKSSHHHPFFCENLARIFAMRNFLPFYRGCTKNFFSNRCTHLSTCRVKSHLRRHAKSHSVRSPPRENEFCAISSSASSIFAQHHFWCPLRTTYNYVVWVRTFFGSAAYFWRGGE